MKDIIDLALLIRSGGLTMKRTADAVHMTFDRRRTHELQPSLPKPPRGWQGRFEVLAEECHLPGDMGALFSEVEDFFERMRKSGAQS